ncbi:metallophosphoesterase [Rosistilla carotiformis]|nr:metallophosphoesterase [Rosistilla carotiformis]
MLILVGHFGLHLTFYNRINATGLQRWQIKLIERSVAVECFLFPIVAYFYPNPAALPAALQVYSWICLAAILVLGIPWLIYRPIFRIGWLPVERRVTHVVVDAQLPTSPFGSLRCRINAALPMNQISHLAIEHKELPVARLPATLDGLRLAHLSDVHLTGDMLPTFYQYVADQLMAWEPEIVCLTGDIVDKADCIAWLPDCFGGIHAAGGCYFILGNHDTRVADPRMVRREMEALGWTDLGGRAQPITLRDTEIVIAGNELPWFGPAPPLDAVGDERFRLVLSHSPDQIAWARRNHVDFMLAGHTHGGHGRLPFAGPLLSPSHYGSRFASGEFDLPPTTMHVTRGLFGTHLQRFRCPPELSLLTLRQRNRTSS